MPRPAFSIQRDRLSNRLLDLAQRLEKPTSANIELVRSELLRLGQG